MSQDDRPEPPPPSDRRSFLKRLTGEAVQAAGSIAGATSMVLRSASAAGEAAAAGLGISQPADETSPVSPEDPAHPAPVPVAATPSAAVPAAPPTPAPVPAAPPPPLRPLTARESALLAATTAVIAVNTVDGTPQLTRAPFHWDGEVARLLGQLFGARIANIQRDGRISVLVGDATGWLTLIGEAMVVTGPAAVTEATPLLARDHPDQTPEDAWRALSAAGDQAVVVLRPTRVVAVPG